MKSLFILASIFIGFKIGGPVFAIALASIMIPLMYVLPRVSAGLAILSLVASPVLLVKGHSVLAEKIAVYSFFMLALSLILYLIEYVQKSEISGIRTQNLMPFKTMAINAVGISAYFTFLGTGGNMRWALAIFIVIFVTTNLVAWYLGYRKNWN